MYIQHVDMIDYKNILQYEFGGSCMIDYISDNCKLQYEFGGSCMIDYISDYCKSQLVYVMYDIDIPWKKIHDAYIEVKQKQELFGYPTNGLEALCRYTTSDYILLCYRVCDSHVKHMMGNTW
jgi:hypothetical protein